MIISEERPNNNFAVLLPLTSFDLEALDRLPSPARSPIARGDGFEDEVIFRSILTWSMSQCGCRFDSERSSSRLLRLPARWRCGAARSQPTSFCLPSEHLVFWGPVSVPSRESASGHRRGGTSSAHFAVSRLLFSRLASGRCLCP